MSRFLKLSRVTALGCTVAIATTLFVACGDRHTMAMKSQNAFEEAQKKGIPIGKGAHGGHTAMGSEEMSGMPGSDAGVTSSAGSPSGMAGMDHSKMPGMSQGQMGGMDHSKMPGMKHGDMKGMDMSGTKHGDMKGMDMSGTKHGDMKGMDRSGMEMSPVVPQPKALQAKPGETAATLRADPLDAPAASSVTSAQQSAEMNRKMASGEGRMTMSMGSYVQHDAGRESSSSQQMNGMEHRTPEMNMDRSGATHQMPGMKHEPTSHSHGETGSGPKKSDAMYVCSSHPEIVRDRPGKCPIDGTPLVKKEKQ
jgi:hypothetical protein